ncbi:MAG: hypothetical protein NVSMB54_14540 [Ktedonobacteraceae bacterium]
MGQFDTVIIQITNAQETEQRETIPCSNCRMVCDACLNFCGRCGQRLRASSPGMRTVPFTPSMPIIAQPILSFPFLIMLGFCILSVLFAIGTGIFAFTRPASNVSIATHGSVPQLISKPEGSAWFYTIRDQDDSVALHLSSLPKLARGTVYMAWLINPLRPDQVLAVGPIIPDGTGGAVVQSNRLPTFNVRVQNLRHIFTQVAVTIEKAGRQWLKPTGLPLLQGALDPKTFAGMVPLFTRSPYTPKQTALLSSLQTQTHELARWLANMLDAQQRNDVNTVRVDLLRFIYLLEGSHGANVARLHLMSQQNVTSVGDSVGLLSFNDATCQRDPHQCGYLGLIQTTVQTLMTQHLVPQTSALRILTTLATIRQLAQSIQQGAVGLATFPKLDPPTLHLLTTLKVQTDALLNGSDSDGDGSIDPVPGEAATAQLYGYMQQLGAIKLT